MTAADCPSQEQLVAYANGCLDDETSELIAEHLDQCPACQSRLTALGDGDDTFVARLRQRPAADGYEEEHECREAAQRAQVLVAALVADRETAGTTAANDALPADLGTLGEYQLLEKLGEGGMGTVYKALQTKLDKTVALKVLPQQRTADPNAVARFEREMKAIGRLEHPNIVRALDAREIDGTHLLVMEYVAGIDLGDVSRLCGSLRIADACEVIRQAAEGLQYAHERGLIHRDLKPSNLILECGALSPPLTAAGRGANDRVQQASEPKAAVAASPSSQSGDKAPHSKTRIKILDFGLARLLGDQPGRAEVTGSGTAMGTADYVAPEQVSDSHSVDIRADIYSLGCTLYKLLAGRPPYVGPHYKSPMEKMLAHLRDTPPPIGLLRTDVPAELAAVVERMMAKDPAARYTAPQQVAEALAPFATEADLGRLAREADAMARGVVEPVTSHVGTEPGASSAHTDTTRQHARCVVPSARLLGPDAAETGARDVRQASAPIMQPAGQATRRLPRPPTLVALGLLGVAILAGVIIVRIVQKSGKETIVEIPDNDLKSVTVEDKPAEGTPPGRSSGVTQPPLQPWHLPKDAPLPAIAPFDATQAKKHQEAWAKYLGVPIEYANSIDMRFVLLPPGEFEMGSTGADVAKLLEEAKTHGLSERNIGRVPSEAPKHRVRITKPFYLGLCEVTQAEYERVMGSNPSQYAGDPNRPVEMVDWEAASMFSRILGELPQERTVQAVYRLPTEAEWEYACRAGTTTNWYCGDDQFTLGEYAWFGSNAGEATHPVRQKKPNAWGLFDMHGNVYEWCRDWFGSEYYGASPLEDPVGLSLGSERVLRGGGWSGDAYRSRAAYRAGNVTNHRFGSLGFRLVRAISAADQGLAGPTRLGQHAGAGKPATANPRLAKLVGGTGRF